MPKQDAAAILDEILGEADALIRQRLKEQGLELPHLVVGTTPDNQIVVRSNSDHEVMRSFGEDLNNLADELTAPPEPGDTTHWPASVAPRRAWFALGRTSARACLGAF